MRPEHLALWRTGDGPSPLVRQKYKLVSEERCRLSCLPCLRPHCFQRVHRSPCPPHSLSLYDDEAESIGPRSSYSSGSLSQRKIYVNRHVDTCSNVARARARAERGEERFAGEGLGSRVTGMQCRISRSPGYRVQEGGGRGQGRGTHTSRCSGT